MKKKLVFKLPWYRMLKGEPPEIWIAIIAMIILLIICFGIGILGIIHFL